MKSESPQSSIAPAACEPAARLRAKRRAAVLCFVLAALLFERLPTIAAVALLGLLLYQLFFIRNRRLIALCLSSLLSWGLFEYAGRRIIERHVAKTHDLDVDHRMKPNPAGGINSDGIRCPFEAGAVRDEDFNVIFLGDSFTFGLWLDDERDAFPAQVERMFRLRDPHSPLRAVNFGWASSSPLLSYRLLRDIGAKYKPDLVVLSLDMTDFSDDIRYRHQIGYPVLSPTLYLIHVAGLDSAVSMLYDDFRFRSIIPRHAVPKNVAMPYFFLALQPFEQSRPFVQETERNIRDIHAFCRDTLKCSFVLLLLPRGFQYSDRESPRDPEAHLYPPLGPHVDAPDDWLADFAARADFPCHSLLTHFRNAGVYPTCFENDPHWNRDGHRVAAEAVYEILQAHAPPPQRE
ncbi:MAG: SGNH/GDSL hydrolase family protein [Phycisphaerae bacterium]|nr:SGNH/GDSL hydrolase family protein [Phycisphaerae bacterium]